MRIKADQKVENIEKRVQPSVCIYHNLKKKRYLKVLENLRSSMNLCVKQLSPKKGEIAEKGSEAIRIVIVDKINKFIENLILEGSGKVSAVLLLVDLPYLEKLVSILERAREDSGLLLEVIVSQEPKELEMRLKMLIIRAVKDKFFSLLTKLQQLEEAEKTVKDYLMKLKDVLVNFNIFPDIGITYLNPDTHIIEHIFSQPSNFLKDINYKSFLQEEKVVIREQGDKHFILFPLRNKVKDRVLNFGLIALTIPSTLYWGLSKDMINSLYLSILKGIDRSYHKSALEKVMQELSALYDVSLSFGSVKSLKDLLRMIVRKAKITLGGDVASLMLIDPSSGDLYIEYAEGLPEEVVRTARQKLGEGIAGRVALTGEPLLIVDAMEDFLEISEIERGVKSAISVPLKSSDNRILGVLNVSKVSPYKFSEEDKKLLFNLATLAANAIERTKLYEDLKDSYQELEETYMSVIASLSKAFEAKDRYHKGHMEKVAKYAMAIALELDPKLLLDDSLRLGAMFHDLGKIAVPDEILHKPSKLTDEEYEVIKIHPEAGEIILKPLKFLQKVAKIVRHHQERWDGKGYPDGLKGEEIPLESRIVAVADAFDAMTSNRPYRKAMPVEDAVQEILRNSGTQFDPKVVRAFYSAYKKGLIP